MSLTIDQITKLEPRVGQLLREAREFDGGSVWQHYENMKRRLKVLVGFGARKPELRTIQAFDVVLNALVERIQALEAMQQLQGSGAAHGRK